ncbi:MAG TPA: hypothetical protein VFF30_14050 [Nitrososphaerales archaeon]|nr:hypothetical protein [Nitrososphaerales archaeon]
MTLSTMTTIEIFKSARIVSIDRGNRTFTASGIDTITGNLRTRTFDYITDATLDNAERCLSEKATVTIDIDSSTKNINVRLQQQQSKVFAEDARAGKFNSMSQ